MIIYFEIVKIKKYNGDEITKEYIIQNENILVVEPEGLNEFGHKANIFYKDDVEIYQNYINLDKWVYNNEENYGKLLDPCIEKVLEKIKERI